MAESDQSDRFTRRLWTHLLVLIAFLGPYVSYRQLSLEAGTQPLLSDIGLLILSGSLVVLVGAYLVDTHTETSARNLVIFHGVVLGLNAGDLLGKWAGYSLERSVFISLGGALVLSFGLLDLYDWSLGDS